MKKLVLLLVLLLSLPALASGLKPTVDAADRLFLALRIGAVVGGGTTYSGTVNGPTPARIVAVTAYTSAAAVGAGNSGFRISDGSNNCDCQISCTTTGTSGFGDAGAKRMSCTGSCTFAPGAALTMASLSACATTQPNVTYAYAWSRP